MVRRRAYTRAFTNAGELHPNLILSSLQIVGWLLFHPSAWRNYVTRIDPALRIDFTLGELGRQHWQNPALQKLLLRQFLVLPLLVGTLTGLVLSVFGSTGEHVVVSVLQWILSEPPDNLMMGWGATLAVGVAFGVAVSIAASLACGLMVSVAAGAIGGFTGGLLTGPAFGLLFRLASTETFSPSFLGVGKPGLMESDVLASGLAIGLSFGAIGFAGSVAGVLGNSAQALKRRWSPMGSVFIGVLAGGVVLALARGTADLLVPADQRSLGYGNFCYGLAIGGVISVPAALAIGWVTGRMRFGFMVGLVSAVTVGGVHGVMAGLLSKPVTEITVASGVAFATAAGIAVGSLLSVLFALPFLLTRYISDAWAGVIAGGIGSGGIHAAFLVANYDRAGADTATFPLPLFLGLALIFLGLARPLWQGVVLYPAVAAWNLLLFRADERRSADGPSLLRWHSAFWDEHQRLPLLGLDEHLLLVMERNPDEGEAALAYLASSRQRWAAQATRIELDARRLTRCGDVTDIRRVYRELAAGGLDGPASSLLASFRKVSEDVDANLQQQSAYHQHWTLRNVGESLEKLVRELDRSSERYAARFRPIADDWRQIVIDYQRRLTVAIEAKQEIDNPYIAGLPVTPKLNTFVKRTGITARIEQLLLDRRRPPLLLYGQRRVGKTSLLQSLGHLLPGTLIPLFVDLQGPPVRARDDAGFLHKLAQGMADSARARRNLILPPLARDELTGDPFTRFDEWLDEIGRALGERTALLLLDELEVLDRAMTKGRFDEEAILGMLRHLIQHRPCFKVLLSTSHTLDELRRWSSYLINVQVVKIGYLNEAEACRLVEHPVPNFALRYEPEACRRVLELTRGHPYLVQLLCSEIVALKNEQDPAVRRLARFADVEAAAPEVLSRATMYFHTLQNQVDASGLALLRFLAGHGEGAVVSPDILASHFQQELERALVLPLRRELLERQEDGYRFQVELIRRWFAERTSLVHP